MIYFSIFLCFLFIAHKTVKRIDLLNKSNYRKRYQELIPLVDGISIYAGLCFVFLIAEQPIAHGKLYLACAAILVFVGALDDRFNISVKIRTLVHALVNIVMIIFARLYLRNSGYALSNQKMRLGLLSNLVMLFAVCAAINAFNMVNDINEPTKSSYHASYLAR